MTSLLERQIYKSSGPRFTSREMQVLHYIAGGNSNKIIASILGISAQTVKQYVSSILYKLNANHRAHAVALGIRSGLITYQEDLPAWFQPKDSVPDLARVR